MTRILNGTFLGIALVALVSATAAAQGPVIMVPQEGVPEGAKPHLAAIKKHLIAAEKAAGDEFSVLQHTLCMDAAAGSDYLTQLLGRQFMTGPDQDMEPVRVFDNLYYVGLRQNGAWAVTTSQGIILLDALNREDTVPRLIPSMRKVGLKPEDIKIVVVSNTAGDHLGGAKYLQEKFGAKIYMSKDDWDFLDKQNPEQQAANPKRDVVVADRQKITLGDTTLTAYFTPGKTVGTISAVIPVKDGNTIRQVAWWGGPQWTLRLNTLQWRERGDQSIAYFRQAAAEHKADVYIESHPMLSGQVVKLFMVKTRKPGQPHPLVIGTEAVQRYLTVWHECNQALTERVKIQEMLYGKDRQKWPLKISTPAHVR